MSALALAHGSLLKAVGELEEAIDGAPTLGADQSLGAGS